MDGFDRETGEVMESARLMPAEIAAAIIAVGKQVKQIGATDKNEHGKYAYVSVDRFYEIIGKMMAEQGLALLVDELSSDVREGKSGNPWVFIQYELRFMHEGGAMGPALRRSCALPISGPQAFGAAQSYIEKQFLRQVFKVPTGEKDADDTAPSESAPAFRQRGARSAGRAWTASEQPEAPTRAAEPRQPAAEPSGYGDAPPLDLEARRKAASAAWYALEKAIGSCDSVVNLDAILASQDWGDLNHEVRQVEDAETADAAMRTLDLRWKTRRNLLLGSMG